jgi:hypothetical protein
MTLSNLTAGAVVAVGLTLATAGTADAQFYVGPPAFGPRVVVTNGGFYRPAYGGFNYAYPGYGYVRPVYAAPVYRSYYGGFNNFYGGYRPYYGGGGFGYPGFYGRSGVGFGFTIVR